MRVKIDLLTKEDECTFSHFLLRQKFSLLYYSLIYRNLLKTYIPAECFYYLARNEKAEIVGCFPLMIVQNEKYGKVANSLPYYGSNGSIIFDDELSKSEKAEVFDMLTTAVFTKIIEEKCVASTFICNPFLPEISDWFKTNLNFDYTDYRIGQITKLPQFEDIKQDLKKGLFDIYSNPRPRNIKKAIKSGVTVRFSNSEDDMRFLFEVHKENIEAIGGKSKEWKFFQEILDITPTENFKILIAELEGVKIAGLLLFYFNKTVEYFTPAIIVDYRHLQPSSLLIFEGMKDAVEKCFCFWNWGGTWKKQKGVYDFKKRWGAQEHKYDYYTMLYDKSLLNLTKEEFNKEFKHVFVIPFDILEDEEI